MKCKICGNENSSLFIERQNSLVCLKCLKYLRKEIDDSYYIQSTIKGDYKLTPRQKKISDEILRRIDNEDILINAVTGAGKTEMIYPLIERMVNNGKKLDLLLLERT